MSSNISTQDKIVTALAVIFGIPLFLLFTGKCSYPTFVVEEEEMQRRPDAMDIVDTSIKPGKALVISTEDYELEKERVKELENEREFLLSQIDEWKFRMENDSALSELRQDLKNAPVAAIVDDSNDDLQLLFRQRDEAITRLASLQAEMNSKIVEVKDQSAENVKNAKTAFEERNSNLVRENKELRGKLAAQSAVGESEEVLDLRSQLADWQGKQRQWQRERNALISERQKLSSVRAELDEMKSKFGQVTPRKLFADSVEDLAPKANLLINRLKGLDKKGSDQMYKVLREDLGAEPITRLLFSSGEGNVKPVDLKKLEDFLKRTADDDLYVAIGYADKSGTFEGNRKLSSKRATNVAKEVRSRKPKSTVQAFYLGQTERFGSKKENRAVELWRISK